MVLDSKLYRPHLPYICRMCVTQCLFEADFDLYVAQIVRKYSPFAPDADLERSGRCNRAAEEGP